MVQGMTLVGTDSMGCTRGSRATERPPTLSGLDAIEKQIAGLMELAGELESKLGAVLIPQANSAVGGIASLDPSSGCALRDRLESLSRGLHELRSRMADLSRRVDL